MHEDRQRRLPPLTALRAFEAAARHRSITLAADELLVTPGAISRQVKQLEGRLGCLLFSRDGGRLTLTPEGELYCEGITRGFDTLETATRVLSARLARNDLALACTPSFHLKWLLPRLPGFEREHPEIRLQIYTGYSASHPFHEAGMDAAIGVGEWPQNASLKQASFMEDRSGPVMTRSVLDHCRSPDGGIDFSRLRRIGQRSRGDIWEAWHAAAKVAWTDGPRSEFDHMFLAIEAVKAGLGACIAPSAYVTAEIKRGELVAPLGFTTRAVPYHIAWPPAEGKKPALATLIDWLRKEGRHADRIAVPA